MKKHRYIAIAAVLFAVCAGLCAFDLANSRLNSIDGAAARTAEPEQQASADTEAPTIVPETEAPAETAAETAFDEPSPAPSNTPVITPEGAEAASPAPSAADTALPTGSPAASQTARPTSSATAKPTPTPGPTPTHRPTAAPTPTPVPVPTAEPTPVPVWDGTGYPPIYSSSGTYHNYGSSGVFRVDNAAYEVCFYSSSAASNYNALLAKVAQQLSGQAQVYSLVVPTAYGVTLPDDIRPKLSNYIDQGACIEAIYSGLSPSVRPVRFWNSIMTHRQEYVFFRTDHHWTQRGAYYAYLGFCSAKGISPYTLSQRTHKSYNGFLGSLYKASGNDSNLLPADTVEAWLPVSGSATLTIYDSSGNGTPWPIVADASQYSAGGKYNAFAGSDNPLAIFNNPQSSGGVLIIVKDSYGNALLPLLVDHYSKIYEVDFRYWTGSIKQLALEVGATDVIFEFNFQFACSSSAVAKLSRITGD